MMSELLVRQYVASVQETRHDESGRVLDQVCRKAWAGGVVCMTDPSRVTLEALMAMGEVLGQQLGQRAKVLLDAPGDAVLAYGKGALIGLNGIAEHAAALLHPRLGKPLRAVLGQGPALIPSTTKFATPGTCLDIPLQSAQNEWDFAMLDTVTVALDTAPRPNEVVVVVALAYGARAGAVIGRS